MAKMVFYCLLSVTFIVTVGHNLYAATDDVTGLRCIADNKGGDFFFKFYKADSSEEITNFLVISAKNSGDNKIQATSLKTKEKLDVKAKLITADIPTEMNLVLNNISLPHGLSKWPPNYRPSQTGVLSLSPSNQTYSVVCCPDGWFPTAGCVQKEKAILPITQEFSPLQNDSEKLEFAKAISNF